MPFWEQLSVLIAPLLLNFEFFFSQLTTRIYRRSPKELFGCHPHFWNFGPGSRPGPGRDKRSNNLNSKGSSAAGRRQSSSGRRFILLGMMLRVAKKPNADPTGIKDVGKGFWLQSPRGFSAQIFHIPLFYSPLEHVERLFCRKTWICGDGIGSTCEINQTHLLRLRKVPFADMFVSLLSNLKAGQSSELEFSFQSVNGNMLFCFAFHKHSVPRTMNQIIKSIYPELRNKRLRFIVQHYAVTAEPGDKGSGVSSMFFYSCEGWDGAGDCPLNIASGLNIHWRGQARYDDQTKESTFSHRLSFCANSAWVNARADDKRIRLERVWLALAMGRHKRLGERSQIGNINSDVLMSIVNACI